MANTHAPPSPKLIKRYTNRKLYDTERSCYVTLEEIADMVKAGDDLRIIDNRTGEDLTSVTLTQIIYEDQKKPDQKKVLPLVALRSIIQSGGEIFSKLTGQAQEEAKRKGSRYDGPWEASDTQSGTRHGEPHLPRYTHRDPQEEVTLREVYEMMIAMDQRMTRMERQLQRMGQQISDIRKKANKAGEGRRGV